MIYRHFSPIENTQQKAHNTFYRVNLLVHIRYAN